VTHMVIFRSAEGKPGYHQADSLEDAVRFVERLRNTESVTDSRIFHMQEVPIEFKQYFRVEVNPSGGPSEAPAVEPAPVVDTEPTVTDIEHEATADLDAPEPVGAANGSGNGRFGLFSHK
jgi:hypothetical protein